MATKVRTVVFHETGKPQEVARVEEVDLPDPEPGQALVRMVAAPINPVDLNTVEGKYPIQPVLPATPGGEGAGIVQAIGAGVDSLAVGDLVLPPRGFGTWREAGLAKASDLIVVPRGIDPIQAAMLKINPPTALRLLRDFVPLQKGDFVLQNAGNSGVGRAVTQIAHALGLRTISLVRRAALIDELKADGADFVFLDDDEAPPRISLAAGGAPIRLAINSVGGESALRLANALAQGATIVTIGAMGRQPLRIPNGLLIFKDLRWRGFWITPWRQRATADENAAMTGEIFALAQRGILRSPVEKMYPIDEISHALAHAQRAERAGKIMLRFDPAS